MHLNLGQVSYYLVKETQTWFIPLISELIYSGNGSIIWPSGSHDLHS